MNSKNEKEILVQRIQTNENNAANSPLVSQQKLNYIDVQVLKDSSNKQQQAANSPRLPSGDSLAKSQAKHKPNVPAFYFPSGKPGEREFKGVDDSETMKQIQAKFKSSKDGKILREDFGDIVKMLDLPRYWKSLLFRECTLNSKINYVTYPILEQVWSK